MWKLFSASDIAGAGAGAGAAMGVVGTVGTPSAVSAMSTELVESMFDAGDHSRSSQGGALSKSQLKRLKKRQKNHALSV